MANTDSAVWESIVGENDITEAFRTYGATKAFHAIYTEPEMMAAWLISPITVRDRLHRAYHCRAVARNPRARFGLDTVPEEVKSVIAANILVLEAAVNPLRRQIAKLRNENRLSWDEVWSRVRGDHGFSHGDSELLGFRH